MTDRKKTEVNLEMCSGFFRIPTEDVIYNITVLPSAESSATKVVEKIIEVEKIVEVEKKAPPAPVTPSPVLAQPSAQVSDDFFQKSAQKFQQEIALAALEADNAPAGAGAPDLGVIGDLAAMANDLKEVLLAMKNQSLSSGSGSAGGGPANLASSLEGLARKIGQAQTLSAGMPALSLKPAAASKTVTRYLFNLDAVFQTIYELCTNETVKGHIQSARAKADEIFNKDVFYDAISPKVGGYPEDDGFLTVPMTDIYTALASACRDKAIGNLLAKMDKQQASIFLDQFLPLEIPAKEEVTVAQKEGAGPAGDAASAAGDGGALVSLLNECRAELDSLVEQSANLGGGQSGGGGDDLLNEVENAITIAASIHYEANMLVEEGSAGQSGDGNSLWLKVKGLAVLAETMLSQKEASPALTFDEGLAVGQDAAQRYLDEVTSKIKAKTQAPPPKEDVIKKDRSPDNFGEASQDDIDRLLEELA